MFVFSPGVQAAVAVSGDRNTYLPVRRIRLSAAGDLNVLSPVFFQSLPEKTSARALRRPEDRLFLLLAALFSDSSAVPFGYVTGIALSHRSVWCEHSLYVSQARLATHTINPEDSIAWAYDGEKPLLQQRADQAMGSLCKTIETARKTPSGILPGDMVAVGAELEVHAESAREFYAGVNGIGSVRLSWH